MTASSHLCGAIHDVNETCKSRSRTRVREEHEHSAGDEYYYTFHYSVPADRKTLFQCSLAFYGRICILSFNKLHLNDFSTRDRKNPNFEHFDQILLTVILNQVIDTNLQLPLICAYAENDLENFIIKVLEMQFNAFMLKNFSQYYA